MDLIGILNDKSKDKSKRRKIVDAIIGGDLSFNEIMKANSLVDDDQITIILEAIDEIANKRLKQLDLPYLELAEAYIGSGSETMKREASKIVGDLAQDYPDRLDYAVKSLIRNINDKSTEVRGASAYGLTKILNLDEYANSSLYKIVGQITEKETDKKIKKQYSKALKQVGKKRK